MRAVRCEACGAKAMIAAARCPTCSHLFSLRDGFGELLPLAYCSSCTSYYPATVGECKWCGTKPEHPPRGPAVWKGVGAAALVVMVGTAILLRGRTSEDGSLVAAQEEMAAKSTPKLEPVAATVPAIPPTSADTTPSVTVPVAETEVIAVSPETATPADPPTTEAATVVRQPVRTLPSRPATKPARPSTRWVSSFSRSWVVVRAGATEHSRIVASIGPNSRVQLGETRGSWRRIKAKGFAGWVETRTSFRVARAR